MARLTRTQKYAELRDQLANDREVSKTTDQLSEFENKLNHIENVLTPKKPETETVAPVVEETVEKIEQTVSIDSLKDVFAPVTETVEEPVFVAPVEKENLEETAVFTKEDFEIHVVENPGVDSDYAETVAEPVEETVTEEVVTPVVEEPVEVEDVINNTVVVETPVVEEPVTVEETPDVEEKYSWEEFESDFTADLDKIISDWKFDDIFKGSLEETAETPVVEETPVTEEVTEVVETPVEETVVEETVTEEPVTVEETVAETPVSFADPFGDVVTEEVKETVEEPVETAEAEEIEIIEETPVTEEVTVVEETPVEEPVTVEEPVKVESNYTDFFEADDEDVTSTFESLFEETPVNLMDETKAEVDEYNSNSGEKNLMEIADTLVEEVRHPETEELDTDEVVETPVTNTKEDDEEFSNTVSMEISKIMDEIKTQEETNPLAEQIEEPVVEKEPEFEHPVLTQALEEPEEDIVEIKNLKEIDIEPVKDATISSTIPFIVTNDDDEEYDEDDDEGSNTILNIILIILIIILVAVLGLIVFYILKTKGII